MSSLQEAKLSRSLSRRELQIWCKKLGLPARKSSSVMADSLLSYFQSNDIHFPTLRKSFGGYRETIVPPSLMPTVHPGMPSYLTGNALAGIPADGYGQSSCHRDGGSKRSRIAGCSELETCSVPEAFNQKDFDGSSNKFMEASQPPLPSRCAGCSISHKGSLVNFGSRFNDIPKSQGIGVNGGAFPTESDCHSVRGPVSFEFYVGLEDGIKLCVDLTSRPSEWIKKYKDQVNLSDNLNNINSRSLHHDLQCVGASSEQIESSFHGIMEPDLTMDGCTQGPSPSSVAENHTHVVVNHSDGDNRSLIPPPSLLLAVEASECLGEDEGPVSFEPNLDAKNQLFSNNVEPCNENGFNTNPDSVITDAQAEKTASNFAVNSTSDGLVDLVVGEHQNSKHDDEACENSILQNSFVENASCVFNNSMTNRFMEMHLSEAGNDHEDAYYENGKFLDLIDLQHGLGSDQDALANSRENDTCGDHMPTCSEEQEWSNNAKRSESSVCSQVDESFEKTCLKAENAGVNYGHYGKRSHADKESQTGSGRCDARVLRSTKHSTGALPRRSMRLVSKVPLQNGYTRGAEPVGILRGINGVLCSEVTCFHLPARMSKSYVGVALFLFNGLCDESPFFALISLGLAENSVVHTSV